MLLGVFELFVAAALVITSIILFTWKTHTTKTCYTSKGCDLSETCVAGYCKKATCNTDKDCQEGFCSDGICPLQYCTRSDDCPKNAACTTVRNNQTHQSVNICVHTGSGCTNDQECPANLRCLAGVQGLGSSASMSCVQCASNKDCPVGSACSLGSCHHPLNKDDKIDGYLTVMSTAPTNGFPDAPDGYYCDTNKCGTSPVTCDKDNPCSSSCPFCVNGSCCTAGYVSEGCLANSDCSSGVCADGTCLDKGGKCLYNYSKQHSYAGNIHSLLADGGRPVSADNMHCPIHQPYCVNGTCSLSQGAECGGSYPVDTCYNPAALGSTTSFDGKAPFCVDGICSATPGLLNNICSDDTSCLPRMHCSKDHRCQ